MDINVLLYQFYSYFFLIGVGFIASRLKIITENNAHLLANLVLSITMPILLFTTITSFSVDIQLVKNVIFTFLFTYIGLLCLFIAGNVSSKLLNLNEREKTIHLMHTMFGNIVFIGFPFLNSLFPGGKGILYAAIFQLAADSILWTYGIIYIRHGRKGFKNDNMKHLVNPATIAFLISILCLVISFKLPTNIEQPISGLGHTTIYLSLLYVGFILSNINIKNSFLKLEIYILSINKLIIIPLSLLILLYFVHKLFPFIEFAAMSAVILQSGMPAMATIAILAKRYGADDELASENILVTTILSIVTLPFLWYIINLFLK